jgi:hypothetical protein
MGRLSPRQELTQKNQCFDPQKHIFMRRPTLTCSSSTLPNSLRIASAPPPRHGGTTSAPPTAASHVHQHAMRYSYDGLNNTTVTVELGAGLLLADQLPHLRPARRGAAEVAGLFHKLSLSGPEDYIIPWSSTPPPWRTSPTPTAVTICWSWVGVPRCRHHQSFRNFRS